MQGTSVLQALADDVDDGSTLTYNIRPGSYLAYDGQRQQVTTTQNFNYVVSHWLTLYVLNCLEETYKYIHIILPTGVNPIR